MGYLLPFYPFKTIKPLLLRVTRCWFGYLSGARCRLFAYGPADATASKKPIISCSCKSRLVLPFWYRITQAVLEKRPLNGCSTSSSSNSKPLLRFSIVHGMYIVYHSRLISKNLIKFHICISDSLFISLIACTFVTCDIKYQSINQSINRSVT